MLDDRSGVSRLGALERILCARRVGQFTLVGVVGALSDLGALAVLHGGVDLALVPAKVGAAEAGIVVAFLLNDFWTFGDERVAGLRATLRRFVTSNAIRAGGLIVSAVVLVVLNVWLGVWYVLANALGLGVGGIVNYVFEAMLAWEVGQQDPDPDAASA